MSENNHYTHQNRSIAHTHSTNILKPSFQLSASPLHYQHLDEEFCSPFSFFIAAFTILPLNALCYVFAFM